VTDLLQSAGGAVLLEVVSAVIVYLAAHPDRRRVEQAVIGEALRERYGRNVPADLSEWLAGQPRPAAAPRRHGARARQRHFHARPVAPEDG
jgi:hypothetical protein